MLRVGILLTSSEAGNLNVSAWVESLLGRIQQSPGVTLAVVGWSAPQRPEAHGLLSPKAWSRMAFEAYERWDRRRSGLRRDALAPSSKSQVLTDTAVLHLQADASSSAEAMRGYDLDLLLCLDPHNFPVLHGAARVGTWLLDVAEVWDGAGVPPLWREHTNGEAAVTRLLHFAPNDDEPRVVYETRTAVDPFSFAKTCSPVYWKAVEVVIRSLKRLAREGAMLPALEQKPKTGTHGGDLNMARFLRKEIVRRLRSRHKPSQQASFAKWCMALRVQEPKTSFCDPGGYTLMVSPRDRFYADPFLFERDGRTWLFFEDFRYAEGRAVISCCEISREGVPSQPFEVLRLSHHLSYPFVFEHDGTVYMIPESRGNRTVSLYRATNFPHGWEFDTDLFVQADMVDTTLHYQNGRWWMFAGVSNGDYSNSDELCIYFADALRGPWVPHPQNPVLSDVRRARPAGRLFREGDRLIRPSQDCGPAYGYGLVFSEVEELTPERYRERVLTELTPESVPGNTANHTYTRAAGIEVIDRFFVESRLAEASTFAMSEPQDSATGVQGEGN